MKNNRNFREEFVKKFITEITPELRKMHQNGSDPHPVSTKPLMVMGQVIGEIETSIDYLKLVPNIITSHSSYYEKKGFSRVQQHRKKIEGYFSEIYILKERVVRMLTLLRKYLLKKGLSKTSKEILLIDSLEEKFIKNLSKILEVRGEHTHKYSYQDKELYHLELLDVSLKNSDYSKEDIKHLYEDLKFDLNQDRKHWKERIEKNSDRILNLLDNIYFHIEDNKLIDKMKLD